MTFLIAGEKARHPSEACMDFYFDPSTSPLTTFVSSNPRSNTRPCPFSGRYTLAPAGSNHMAVWDLLEADDNFDRGSFEQCDKMEVVMHAGCSSEKAAELKIESSCLKKYSSSTSSSFGMLSDEPETPSPLKTTFTCHGRWTETASEISYTRQDEVDDKYMTQEATIASLLRSPGPGLTSATEKHVLMLSVSSSSEVAEEENSLTSRRFVCLVYTEHDGVLLASASSRSCDASAASPKSHFNITSSGPCLQALTGKAVKVSSWTIATMLVPISLCLLFDVFVRNVRVSV